MCRGVTLPRCYTIRVLCCVNNTIWNLEVPQYRENLLSKDWRYMDRGHIADAAGDDLGVNVAGVRGLIKVIFS
ncbi:hypothetical protein [Anaplasma phagocytophilum]|uniref:hypothetical protein n=1 Tax=Anaplasma phagocytophilum TaxID=948 RepID=UPI000AE98686|nr:hypothetical protein [Anaplasma phagocytophilum]